MIINTTTNEILSFKDLATLPIGEEIRIKRIRNNSQYESALLSLEITLKQIRTKSRKGNLPLKRKAFSYYLREQKKLKVEEIARIMKYKHHASVLDNLKKCKNAIDGFDAALLKEIEKL